MVKLNFVVVVVFCLVVGSWADFNASTIHADYLKEALNSGIDDFISDMSKDSMDYSGSTGRVSYHIQSARFQSFSRGSASINATSPGQVSVKLNNLEGNFAGKLGYRYKRGWVKISDTISITGSATGIGISVTVDLGVNNFGRVSACDAQVDNIKLNFPHGFKAWIHNFFLNSSLLNRDLKGRLPNQMCEKLKVTIAKNAKSIPSQAKRDIQKSIRKS